MLNFDNVNSKDQELLMNAKVHYYVEPVQGGNSCQIDRFECYPNDV